MAAALVLLFVVAIAVVLVAEAPKRRVAEAIAGHFLKAYVAMARLAAHFLARRGYADP